MSPEIDKPLGILIKDLTLHEMEVLVDFLKHSLPDASYTLIKVLMENPEQPRPANRTDLYQQIQAAWQEYVKNRDLQAEGAVSRTELAVALEQVVKELNTSDQYDVQRLVRMVLKSLTRQKFILDEYVLPEIVPIFVNSLTLDDFVNRLEVLNSQLRQTARLQRLGTIFEFKVSRFGPTQFEVTRQALVNIMDAKRF